MEEVTVVKEFTFDAAHQLPGYDGPCRNLHGHTYRLQIGVRGEIISAEKDKSLEGMVLDFSILNRIVKEHILQFWDHAYLNDVFPMRPTAENMVLWILDHLRDTTGLDKQGLEIVLIRLWETPTSFAEWRKG